MAILPQIEYGPVESVANAALPGAALHEMGKTLEQGFLAYSHELVKTQQMKAAATLQERLNNITLNIQSQQSIDAGTLRNLLGGEVPSHLAGSMKVQKVDPKTGQLVQVDNDQIPMFLAGGAIYDKQAKDAVREAMGNIAMPGWQADFQDKAAAHVEQRKMLLAEQQLHAMHQYQVTEQSNAAERLRRSGAYDAADELVRSSQVLSGAEKVKEIQKTQEERQIAPILDAEKRGDMASLQAQLRRLESPNPAAPGDGQLPTDAITQEHRSAYADRLRRQMSAMETQAEKAREKWFKDQADAVYGRIASYALQAKRAGQQVDPATIYSMIDPKKLRGEDVKHLLTYADSVTKMPDQKTNNAVYQTIAFYASENPVAFRDDKIKLPNGETVGLLAFTGGLSSADFQHFVGIQTSLRKEGLEAAAYHDFLGPERAVNYKLATEYGYDLKSVNENTKGEIGRVKLMVNFALSQGARDKGGRLSTSERDAIIDKTMRQELKRNKGFVYDDTTMQTAGVDPELAYYITHALGRAGYSPSPQEIVRHAKDFGYYRDGIESAWSAQSAKPLGVEAAVSIHHLLKSDWASIDAEIAKSGQMPTAEQQKDPKVAAKLNELRTALAVQGYLKLGGR